MPGTDHFYCKCKIEKGKEPFLIVTVCLTSISFFTSLSFTNVGMDFNVLKNTLSLVREKSYSHFLFYTVPWNGAIPTYILFLPGVRLGHMSLIYIVVLCI